MTGGQLSYGCRHSLTAAAAGGCEQVMGLEIPMRDLRLMDPALGSTFDTYAQILVRENAMVVSIEYVRLIISADKVRVFCGHSTLWLFTQDKEYVGIIISPGEVNGIFMGKYCNVIRTR